MTKARPSRRTNTTNDRVRRERLSPRGQRSRDALITAARTVFARDGFQAARITDIADEAALAHGTFYTYFSSKEEIFQCVLDDLGPQLLGARGHVPQGEAEHGSEGSEGHRDRLADPRTEIIRSNRAYLEAYRKHHGIMAAWEQLASIDEDFKRLRAEANRVFVNRVERSILRLQAERLADPDVDAHVAAVALTGMVSRYASVAVGEDPFDLERAVTQLSRLWANAIGLLDKPAS